MRIAIDVEEHLLQDVARVRLARVAAETADDLGEELGAVQLVEQAEAAPAALVAEGLHQERRDRVSDLLGAPRGVVQDAADALELLLADLPLDLGDPLSQTLRPVLSEERRATEVRICLLYTSPSPRD